MLGAGGAAILTPIIQPLLDHTIESTLLVNLVLLIGSAAFIIFLRLYLSKVLRNQLHKKVDIDYSETVMIKTRPKFFKQYFLPLMVTLSFGTLAVVMFYLFLITSELIPLVVFLIMFPMSLFRNWTFINPDFGKTNLYRVNQLS